MKIKIVRADVMSMKVDAMVSPTDGETMETTGGNLLCRFVIHVPQPARGDDEQWKLRQATLKALERAEELAVATVALPPFWKSDHDECARVMMQAVRDFSDRARSLQRVVFLPVGEASHEIFERAMADEES